MNNRNILLTLLFALGTFSSLLANNYVIINQVMYDSPLNEQVNTPPYSHGEFIELYNGGDSLVSLDGWSITGDGTTECFSLSDIQMPSQSYLVLAFTPVLPSTFQLSEVYDLPMLSLCSQIVYQNSIVLANKGETLTLYNANQEIVDRITYDGTSHKTKPDRLCADNQDGLDGNLCVSLHRTWVEFDEQGRSVLEVSQWKTELVSFGVCRLSEPSFGEQGITAARPLPNEDNYILTISPLDPTTRVSSYRGVLSVSRGVRTRSTIQYYDGLGRPRESIDLSAAPDRRDMVTMTHYQGLNQVDQTWLPIPIRSDGQPIELSDIQTQARVFYGDERPYVETLYEQSSLHRALGVIKPGQSWSTHPSTMTYMYNSESDYVRVYRVLADGVLQTTGSTYPAGMLYKQSQLDEDGRYIITYTDKLGQKILEDREGSLTYYVYDDLGRLRYVLPHIAQSTLTNGEYAPSNVTLCADAYYYQYDKRGNVVLKRIPGSEPILLVYDKMGQLVLTQDGNQRVRGAWTLCAYDSIGRNVYTAEITSTQTHCELIEQMSDLWQVEHYGGTQANAIAGTGYASTIFGRSNLRLLTVNYYDNYDYLSRLSTPIRQSLRFEQVSGYGLQHESALGLLTGSRVYNLSEDGYTAEAYYYDAQARVVQSRSSRSDGSTVITSMEYLFDGTVSQQLSVQSRDGATIREHYRYTYDHVGRAKQTFYQLDDKPEILLSAFSYDSIGRMVQNLLYESQDTIAYSYDIRGMLTETRNKHFSERLYYADNLPQSAVACYNGNIAAAIITHPDSAYTFAYRYDKWNRLIRSVTPMESGDLYSESFEYDEVGNITRLKRFANSRLIDDLTYWYGSDGNQLLSVTESGQDADLYGVVEYHAGTLGQDTTMRYDANGNLIFDADRGISAIHYNRLNLPDTIQFANGNQIVNLYDATGHKYKSITYTKLVSTVTPFGAIEHYTMSSDSVVYRVIDFAGNVETIYTLCDTTQRINNSIGYFSVADNSYYYSIKDHLGNVCAVVNATADSLVQSTMYYASGVPMPQSMGREVQPYLYNGKEFVEAHGYDVFDYGFRGYYATIGRFTSIDPLAEQTPWQSPYVYAGNNFINSIDWMGLMGTRFQQWLTILDEDYNVLFHMDGDWGVYIWQGEGNFDLENYSSSDLNWVGFEIPMVRYEKGKPCLYLREFSLGYSPYNYPMYQSSYFIAYGRNVATPSQIRQGMPISALLIDVLLTLLSGESDILKEVSKLRFGLGFIGCRTMKDFEKSLGSIVPGYDIIYDLKNIYDKYVRDELEQMVYDFQDRMYYYMYEPFML